MNKQKDALIALRLPTEMKNRISLVADSQERSEYIRHLIRKDLSERVRTPQKRNKR